MNQFITDSRLLNPTNTTMYIALLVWLAGLYDESISYKAKNPHKLLLHPTKLIVYVGYRLVGFIHNCLKPKC